MNTQPGAPYLHQDVLSDVAALQQAASRAGFELRIASGYRAFERQLAIWNGKFNGKLPVLDANSQPMDLTHLSDKNGCTQSYAGRRYPAPVDIIGELTWMYMINSPLFLISRWL
jgi:D-alanyl-D-alanine carboxypeptidase